MTTEQIDDAIRQMISHCETRLAVQYDMDSARGVLNKLGYDEDQIILILVQIATRGFNYCLDYTISSSSHFMSGGKETFPEQQYCTWGLDQLVSRLRSVQ